MFLYFIPHHAGGSVTRADFEALGLGYALGVGDPDARKITANGPGGQAGSLAVVQSNPDAGEACRVDTLYEPAKQVWRKGPSGKYWVGYCKDRRPTPAGLARAKLIDGEWTPLGQGGGDQEWLIPVARSIVRGTTLPKGMVLGEDFETWAPAELPEFLELCNHAGRAWEVLTGADVDVESGKITCHIPYADGMKICVAALAVNYRVGPIEVSMMGLTNTDMWAVLRALCDVPMVERVLADRKKKEGATSGSSPTGAGSPDSSPDTSPPSAT